MCVCGQCIPSEWVFGLTADQVLETICSFCEDMICVFSTTCKCFWKNWPPSIFLEDSLEKQLENQNHQRLTCLIYTTKVVFSIKVHLDRHYFNKKIEIRNYCYVEKSIFLPCWNTSISIGYEPMADWFLVDLVFT